MEDYSITRVTPEYYGYKDRKIVKWLEMMLSDHTESLKKEKHKVTEIEPKEEMKIEEISEVLHRAYVMGLPVAIQANTIRNGSYYKDVQCKLADYGGGKIHLYVIDGRKTSCAIEEIRNVEFMDVLDWYGKRV
ncbi:YolD-like family protein [Oceanobacillus jeddahense]|uniref:YolD-like family protein n=1 Tax=Oceanobacillus jeddahense TaxID=1462527 RepID=A0ABY5JN87_9BACI|nr:YolD-like family protein [Oceanobacillus jeddahense]UUI01754.1 YolD-like family protein [Oceanobacillus jeddahense]